MPQHPAQSEDPTYPAHPAAVDVQEAKKHPAALIARAEAGEEIVITRAGRPVVKLVPIEEPPRRKFGGLAFGAPDDFDTPLDEEESSAWE